MSSMAARAITVPRTGWAENKMNSLFGSKLWFTFKFKMLLSSRLQLRLWQITHLLIDSKPCDPGWRCTWGKTCQRRKPNAVTYFRKAVTVANSNIFIRFILTLYHDASCSHGDIVAHVGGDVDAQVLLLARKVQCNVVHVPGQLFITIIISLNKNNHLSCSASSLSSLLSRARRLDSQWMMKPE